MGKYMSDKYANSLYIGGMSLMMYCSIISLIFSMWMLALMLHMKIYKERLMSLVFVMTIMQIIYDQSLIPFCGHMAANIPANDAFNRAYGQCRGSEMALTFFSAISSSACTNILSILVAYVIITKKQLHIRNWVLWSIIFVPGVIAGVFGYIFFESYISELISTRKTPSKDSAFDIILIAYDAIRTVQFGMNMICVVMIFAEIKKNMKIGNYSKRRANSTNSQDTSTSTSTSTSKATNSSDNSSGRYFCCAHTDDTKYPMFLLAMRLMWYPIVQGITGFVSAFYHWTNNGESIELFKATVQNNPNWRIQTIQFFLLTGCLPLAGPLYTLIFLKLQRGAWTESKRQFWLFYAYIRYCGNFNIEDAPPSGLATTTTTTTATTTTTTTASTITSAGAVVLKKSSTGSGSGTGSGKQHNHNNYGMNEKGEEGDEEFEYWYAATIENMGTYLGTLELRFRVEIKIRVGISK